MSEDPNGGAFDLEKFLTPEEKSALMKAWRKGEQFQLYKSVIEDSARCHDETYAITDVQKDGDVCRITLDLLSGGEARAALGGD